MRRRQVYVPPILPPVDIHDPFRFGWRDIPITLPDGSFDVERIPLTEEDLLSPQEGDHIVHPPEHWDNVIYFSKALEFFLKNVEDTVVLGDCGVEFGVPGLRRHLVPDATVLEGVQDWQKEAIFRIRHEGGRPLLVVEATSPSTYRNDVVRKVNLYLIAGVYKYVIYDRGPDGNQPPRLVGRVREGSGWRMMELDEQGRLDLEPLPLWLGIEDNRPWYYVKETGERLPDYSEAVEELAEATAAARTAVEAREVAERDSREAQLKVRQEALARKQAETKARDEAKARENAETKARDAEAKVREEAKAREDAEAKARKEAKAREGAEAKVREEAKAREDAEAKARKEAKAREDAEAKVREQAKARGDAEAKARDAEARVQAADLARVALEERLRQLEEELKRRSSP